MAGNYIRTNEYKKKMSEKLKGRKVTWGDKISKGRKGIKLTEETKRKMSEAHKGISHPNMSRKGEKNPMWKGGKFQDKRGYIMLYKPYHPFARRGYVMEHRLIMEEYLDRFLGINEIVHHLNGIKNDNRIENLCIMKKGEHINQTEPYKKRIRELEKMLSHYPKKREGFPNG